MHEQQTPHPDTEMSYEEIMLYVDIWKIASDQGRFSGARISSMKTRTEQILNEVLLIICIEKELPTVDRLTKPESQSVYSTQFPDYGDPRVVAIRGQLYMYQTDIMQIATQE